MGDSAVSVRAAGKKYRIGGGRTGYGTIREVLARMVSGNRGQPHTQARGEFWALRDVTFEVPQGEVLGIIGRNGAGKSTLLKLLSRVTRPTEGTITTRGRVASLLEVGSGFHPELSGRDNVFLNGSILGMSRGEIKGKFDQIVAFAEVERFIDTPVKHYSSGMYLRLAFAVAAHLDPDILIVDEVLAVGDAEFQEKCLGRMRDISSEGRTVLLVSHTMAAVTQLCSRALWLDRGSARMDGPAEDVVAAYLAGAEPRIGERMWTGRDQPGTPGCRLLRVASLGGNGEATGRFDIRKPIVIEVEYAVLAPMSSLRVAVQLRTPQGVAVFHSVDSDEPTWGGVPRPPGVYVSRCAIPGDFLNSGTYLIGVSSDVPLREVLYEEDAALEIAVEQTGGVHGLYNERWPGVVRPALEWHTERHEAARQENPCATA